MYMRKKSILAALVAWRSAPPWWNTTNIDQTTSIDGMENTSTVVVAGRRSVVAGGVLVAERGSSQIW
ncbi:hypothetical protein AC579_6490 [Pseudocercospora musae]|uniref:Uncharacterized protein n=1 Tax=Pseudocercospora musae TaxID=113226 RepID=A0A139IAL7_9PEZI|nr:hypothetical protein AC579_6490 [Pseudocercospora musae]